MHKASLFITAGLLLGLFLVPAGASGDDGIVLPRGGQTQSHAAGDDGALKSGVVWPHPRFFDNGDGIRHRADAVCRT